MTTREEWLAARRAPCADGLVPVHASEAFDILFGEPMIPYAAKLGVEHDESYLLRRGQRMEKPIIEEFAEESGRTAYLGRPYEVWSHPAYPWLRCTPDAWVDDDVAQIKLATGSAGDWKEGPPFKHVIQVQFEIACTRSICGWLIGLLGPGPLVSHCLQEDRELVELAIPRLQEFRGRVRDQRPPEPRSSDALPALRKLFARGDGSTIELDDKALGTILEFEYAKLAESQAGEWKGECESKLRAWMGNASFASLPDGSRLERQRWGKGERFMRIVRWR